MPRTNYFVSFHWEKGTDSGFGMTEVRTLGCVTSYDQLAAMAKSMESNWGYDRVTILNWKRLDE